MRMNSKKGVSPLIATVLIIALTVALTVFLMNWAFGFFKERTDETSRSTTEQLRCTQVDLNVECGCQAGPTGSCSFTFSNDNPLTLPEGYKYRLIGLDGKSVSGEAADTSGEILPFKSDSRTITKPLESKQPYDLEVVVPSFLDERPDPAVTFYCGGSAKARVECKVTSEAPATTTTTTS